MNPLIALAPARFGMAMLFDDYFAALQPYQVDLLNSIAPGPRVRKKSRDRSKVKAARAQRRRQRGR